MSKFYIQSGYQGKEVGSLLFNYPKESFSYSAREEWAGQPIVGSVEFVEQHIGIKTPNYYPDFLSSYFHRSIWKAENLPIGQHCFIKPADRHKRFDARVFSPIDSCLRWVREYHKGPYWISDVVCFKEEWRYYITNGEVLASYWYQGNEEEIEPPLISGKWPKDFCGAVDFGRLDTGEIALVENNLPYACGWYGPHSEGKVYGEWLEKSWEYVLTCP